MTKYIKRYLDKIPSPIDKPRKNVINFLLNVIHLQVKNTLKAQNGSWQTLTLNSEK